MKLSLPKFFSNSDWLHVVIGLMCFCSTWAFSHIGTGIIATFVLAILKELNDKYGWVKALLTNPKKKKTGFSIPDVLKTVAIPLIVYVIFILI